MLMTALVSGSLSAQTLVTVNGQTIDSSVIDAQVAALRAANNKIPDSPELRRELTERQVINTVVSQEAKRLKLDQRAEFNKLWNMPVRMPKNKVPIKKHISKPNGRHLKAIYLDKLMRFTSSVKILFKKKTSKPLTIISATSTKALKKYNWAKLLPAPKRMPKKPFLI